MTKVKTKKVRRNVKRKVTRRNASKTVSVSKTEAKKLIEQFRRSQKSLTKEGFKLIKEETVDFTQELAEYMCKLPEFVGERELHEDHVLFLAGEMEDGNFLWAQTALVVAVCSWDKKERRLNGNHTSVARTLFSARSDNPKIRVLRYRVDSEDEFRRLYSKIDRMFPRTRAHVGKARLLESSEFKGISKTVMTKLLQGHNAWKAEHGRFSVDASADLLSGDENVLAHNVAGTIKETLNARSTAFLRKAGVYGAMFATFNKVVGDSQAFWGSVINGLNFSSNHDPAKTLRDWLIQCSIRTNTPKTHNITSETILRACILAFNKYRKCEELQFIRVSATTKRPRVV